MHSSAPENIEQLLNEGPNDIEISHWRNFLSKLSGIPRDELIKNAIEIKESKDDKEKKEIEYLGIVVGIMLLSLTMVTAKT